jgi:hypothetical protein
LIGMVVLPPAERTVLEKVGYVEKDSTTVKIAK